MKLLKAKNSVLKEGVHYLTSDYKTRACDVVINATYSKKRTPLDPLPYLTGEKDLEAKVDV